MNFKILSLFTFLSIGFIANAQVTIWTEDFQNSCVSNCLASVYSGANGAWSVALIGVNGADANRWYVSGAECGNAAGTSGSVCGAVDPSLHLGFPASFLGDNGASYLAGGLGFFAPSTDKRVESPTINLTGESNITLNFNYIESLLGGVGYDPNDDATLWYFNGTVWAQLDPLAVTSAGFAPQGTWTAFSIALPVSANNNPNVKIGFRWVNIDDNTGIDPTFAVDDITLTVPSVVTVPIASFTTSSNTVCQGSAITFTDNSTVSGATTYTWSFPTGTPATANTQGPHAVTFNTVGPHNINLSVTDVNGTDDTTITITVIAPPTVAAAGSNQSICGTTATLAGNTATIGVGTWTLISGSGTITTPTSPTSGITALGVGANIFQWTITNAPCPASTDQVTITGTANTTTIAAAGSNQSICGTAATLAGNTATVGTGTWTLISGSGTITTPASPTSGITALGIGANVFQWTITNAPCPNTTDQVTITGVATPTVATAGADQTICGTTATLAGNTATVGTGTWTLISGSGTITATTSPTSGITTLGIGANVFQWTIANTPCPNSTDQVTITGVATPTVATAGSDQTICGTTATLAGNTATIGTGTWTLISGAGTITTPASPTSGITALGIGANVFQWTITNAPCPNTTDQVTITGVATPTVATAGSDQTICITTATLAGNTATIGTGTWTLISGAGTITTPASPTSGITGLGIGANVFQWTIANAPCPNSTDQVTITVNNCSAPIASFSTSFNAVCEGNTITFTDNSTVSGTTTYSWTFPTGIPATANTQGPHTVTFNTQGTHNIILSVTDANGTDDTTITINVLHQQNATIILTADTTVCSDDLEFQLLSVDPGGVWAGLGITDPANGFFDPETAGEGTHTISYAIGGTCGDNDTKDVVVEFCGEVDIFLPNIFSPNNDGANDVYFVRGNGIASFEFKIFNRWGELVFKTTDLIEGWDGTFNGTELDAGTFYYYLEAEMVNSETMDLKGTITLLK